MTDQPAGKKKVFIKIVKGMTREEINAEIDRALDNLGMPKDKPAQPDQKGGPDAQKTS